MNQPASFLLKGYFSLTKLFMNIRFAKNGDETLSIQYYEN